MSDAVRKDIQKQKERGKKTERGMCVREEKDRTVECEKKA